MVEQNFHKWKDNLIKPLVQDDFRNEYEVGSGIVWNSLKQNMSTVFFYLNNVNNFIVPNMLFKQH